MMEGGSAAVVSSLAMHGVEQAAVCPLFHHVLLLYPPPKSHETLARALCLQGE